MADNDKAEKARVLLANRLRELQAAGFLNFEDIVRRLQKNDFLGPCIAKLAKLIGYDGFEKIYGDLYDKMHPDRELTLNLWKKALVGEIPFAYGICDVVRDELPHLFERWLTEPDRATWDQLVSASPYVVLRACADEGDKRADEAVAEEETTVVEATAAAEVTEEDFVEDVSNQSAAEDAFAKKASEEAEIVPEAPPADSGDPYDGKKDIVSP